MIRPDKPVIVALASLGGNQNFEMVLAWIAQSREDSRDALEVTKDERDILRFQGYSQALKDILDHAKNAADILRKTGR